MNRPPPIETRLLGLTPHEYQRLKLQASHEAARLRNEAIGAAVGSAIRQVARLIVQLRPRLEPLRAARP